MKFAMKMVSLRLACAATLVAILSYNPSARAADYDCPPDNLRLPGNGPDLHDLWGWVRAESGLNIDAPPPKICRVDVDEMEGLRPDTALDSVALYDGALHQILLTAPWDPKSAVDQSVIVHELVHHAQAISGKRLACPAAGEAEAYEVQAKWLARTGLNLHSSFGIDPLTRLVLVTCGM